MGLIRMVLIVAGSFLRGRAESVAGDLAPRQPHPLIRDRKRRLKASEACALRVDNMGGTDVTSHG
jgi:hypothetical protein